MASTDPRGQETESPEEARTWYTVDPEVFEAQGRSAALMALHRRCSRCWATLINVPNVLARVSYDEHRERLAACCSQQQDYIMPQMPVLEAGFRILLASEPPVRSLEELNSALMERWTTPSFPRSLAPETLRRILAADHYYGIREVAAPVNPDAASTAS